MSDKEYVYPYHYTRTTLPGVEVKRTDSAKENQCVARVDAAGYVVALSSTREPGDFLAAMARLPRFPLDPADIVWPAAQVQDSTLGTTYERPTEEKAA